VPEKQSVPALPVQPERVVTNVANSRVEQSELARLDEEVRFQRIVNRDRSQKFWLRWIAAGTGLVVILGMAGLVAHVMHHLTWWPVQTYSSSVLVALFVAPLLSITTVTIALFVGAFRRFRDDDLDKMPIVGAITSASQAFTRS
jgi:hypothetical protein